MTDSRCDAVVVGGGPNGLVAAIALADAGWDVELVEQQDEVGGAVRSASVTAPGHVTDLFSAFYPLAAASPVVRDLGLTDHGLEWVRAPDPVGHAFPDGRGSVVRHRAEDTAAELDAAAPGDGDAWLEVVAGWDRVRDSLLDALFTPFPPARAAVGVLRSARTSGTLDLARLALSSVRRFGHEQFSGDGARVLFTGNSMHSDLHPDGAGSALFGWLLVMLAQDVGFPVPRGGAGELSQAMRRRAEAAGVRVRCGSAVEAVLVRSGRARGVRLEDGSVVHARRAVLADVPAPMLYRDLVGAGHLPPRFVADLDRFQWDPATLKVNWALDGSVPWSAPQVRGAGTVHLGADDDGLVDTATDLTLGRMPHRPFLLFGQMSTADPSRSPAGSEATWAYTHLPRALATDREAVARQLERTEDMVEEVAPGFRDRVLARYVQDPSRLESEDAGLSLGSLNGGTAGLHQQLVFRPTKGLGRPETPVPGLYLASSSAHPGGGVHGACGWNAALSALRSTGPLGAVRTRLAATAWARVLRD